ncbi:nicotinate-nucleotide--dimethylbenzimidazole phosphoribosyltransferase [Granulicella tundricola]|uniref:Nicotinate-nucleotide--dimethylbenzimidazole phosphoribosyltransferase n=1 Tax=Granulicella tundricola (strain ATCC BAA-1859 / DSM 23138 / MP5ACTX9) TaxID=1198114 RepID=E8X1C8_GRATM|nr:nicotinate-nucleotide--dimethylbenzimidazole phosphoribosyltransferase [Granulicella tundricola]ADW69082.1 nicotinate-nucleotide/dimethylbenzimidazole phosphoribosyltransferase [Granulicella tundricola MP5ACTX9]
MTPDLQDTIANIPAPAPEALFRAHLDTLTKPLGALGRLEDLAAQLQTLGLTDLRKAAWVFAADHGIAAEGVSAYPAEVTRQMVLNFLSGGAAINVLSRLHNAPVHIVNAGVATALDSAPTLRNTPIRPGSRNMLHEPALSEAELNEALALGIECAAEASAKGFNLIAVGEMGIANTTAASALTAALTGRALYPVTGRGTGLDDAAHAHKIAVLEAVLAHHEPHLTTPEEILRRLGGLEVAAMTGFILGCASHRIALIIDGFISTAAAACAVALAPQVHSWLFAGHQSQEPGHRILLAHLNLTPILTLDMRLGEGTGAVLAMPILESALALYTQMATFTSAGVSAATAL